MSTQPSPPLNPLRAESKTARSRRDKITWLAREVFAILIWSFVVLKIFVIDIDSVLLKRFLPGFMWLSDFRLIVFIAVASVCWLIYKRAFVVSAIYVLVYPLAVLFWKLPRQAWKSWPFLVPLLPALLISVKGMRWTFVLYSVFLSAAVIIVWASDRAMTFVSLVAIGLFFMVYLLRSLRVAWTGPLGGVLLMTREAHRNIESGALLQQLSAAQSGVQRQDVGDNDIEAQQVSILYLCHWSACYLVDRVKHAARWRIYDLYLLVSWGYLWLMTAVVFALSATGLARLQTSAYSGTNGPGFGQFLMYSVSLLVRAHVSSIQPRSVVAQWLAIGESIVTAIIIVGMTYSLFTVARGQFKDDVQSLIAELGKTAFLLEVTLKDIFQVTATEAEWQFFDKMPGIVNFLRRLQGQAELRALHEKAIDSIGSHVDAAPIDTDF